MKITVLMYDVRVARGCSHYRRHCLDWNTGYEHIGRGHSRSKGCTAECGNLRWLEVPLFQQTELLGIHTGQGLTGRSGRRGSGFRVVLQVTEFVFGTRSLGLNVVHHGSCRRRESVRDCSSLPPTRSQSPRSFLLPLEKMSLAAI